MNELIRVHKLPNIPRNEKIEELYEVIGRKTRASPKADRQLCTGIYRHSGSCHSAIATITTSLSLYPHTYTCMVSEPQVSDAPHVAQLSFRTCTSQPSKSKKQTLEAKSRAFA